MTSARRPDLEFVLAALRCDATAVPARTSAAARVADWDAVVRLAGAHDVTWWVVRALPATGVPAEVRAAALDRARAVAVGALAGARQLAELCRALAAAGVRAVAYKGPALAAELHGDPGARDFTDLDLLIAAADRDRAVAVLRAAGYESPARYTVREERVYSRWEGATHLARDGALPVEVHWRVQAPRYGGPQDPSEIVERAHRFALGGGTVLVPQREDVCVLLALHGVKHAWSSLLWLADFVAAASQPAVDWTVVRRRAAEWGVGRALHCALLLARDLALLDVPHAVRDAAAADVPAAALARDVAAHLAGDGASVELVEESTPRYDLRWLDGAWARARYLALALALPTPREREALRLPDALLPLAYPLRVIRMTRHLLGRRS
ncbi:MAG: nucleotidyltransferase family protein [Gemmatimonadaceae bacterium]